MRLQILVWKLHIGWLVVRNVIHRQKCNRWLESSINIINRVAVLPRVRGPVSYIVCLHEFGHLYSHRQWGDYDHVRSIYTSMLWGMPIKPVEHDIMFLCELQADEWAIKNAIGFNHAMGRTLMACLRTYEGGRYNKLNKLSAREQELRLKNYDYTTKQGHSFRHVPPSPIVIYDN